MFEWIKKIHMYAGLFTFSAFVIWGLTGIHAVFLPPPGGYTPPEISSVREVPFKAAGDLDDKQLAKQIYDSIEVPLAGGHYNIRRDDDLNLAFFIFTSNGRRDVTYLEDRSVVRVAHRRNDLWGFLSSMHTAHSRRHALSFPSRMWGYYNEFSNWAFVFMTISGVYMWLATRPRLPWARLSLALSIGVAVGLWVLTR